MIFLNAHSLAAHAERSYQLLAAAIGVNVLELHILHDLFVNGDDVSASKLAHRIERAPTSFTPILDKLAGKGFIVRRHDPNDRRAIRIGLLPKAEPFRDRVISEMAAIERTLVADIPDWLPVNNGQAGFEFQPDPANEDAVFS